MKLTLTNEEKERIEYIYACEPVTERAIDKRLIENKIIIPYDDMKGVYTIGFSGSRVFNENGTVKDEIYIY